MAQAGSSDLKDTPSGEQKPTLLRRGSILKKTDHAVVLPVEEESAYEGQGYYQIIPPRKSAEKKKSEHPHPPRKSKKKKKSEHPHPQRCAFVRLETLPPDIKKATDLINGLGKIEEDLEKKRLNPNVYFDFQVWLNSPSAVTVINCLHPQSDAVSFLLIRNKINHQVIALVPLPLGQTNKFGKQILTIQIDDPRLLDKVEWIGLMLTKELKPLESDKVAFLSCGKTLTSVAEYAQEIIRGSNRWLPNRGTMVVNTSRVRENFVVVLSSGAGDNAAKDAKMFTQLVARYFKNEPVEGAVENKADQHTKPSPAPGSEKKDEVKITVQEAKKSDTVVQSFSCLVPAPRYIPYQTKNILDEILKRFSSLEKSNIVFMEEAANIYFHDLNSQLVCCHVMEFNLWQNQPNKKLTNENIDGKFRIAFVSVLNPSEVAEMAVCVTFDAQAKELLKDWLPDTIFRAAEKSVFSDLTALEPMSCLTEMQTREVQKKFDSEFKAYRDVWTKEITPLHYYSSFINYNGFLSRVFAPALYSLHSHLLDYHQNRFCCSPYERWCKVFQLQEIVLNINERSEFSALRKEISKTLKSEFLELMVQINIELLFLTEYVVSMQKMSKCPLQLTQPGQLLDLPYPISTWERAGVGKTCCMVLPLGVPALYFYCTQQKETRAFVAITRKFEEKYGVVTVTKSEGPVVEGTTKGVVTVLINEGGVASSDLVTPVEPIFPPPLNTMNKPSENKLSVKNFINCDASNLEEYKQLIIDNYTQLFREADKLAKSDETDIHSEVFLCNPAFVALDLEGLHPEIFRELKKYSNLAQRYKKINLPGQVAEAENVQAKLEQAFSYKL